MLANFSFFPCQFPGISQDQSLAVMTMKASQFLLCNSRTSCGSNQWRPALFSGRFAQLSHIFTWWVADDFSNSFQLRFSGASNCIKSGRFGQICIKRFVILISLALPQFWNLNYFNHQAYKNNCRCTVTLWNTKSVQRVSNTLSVETPSVTPVYFMAQVSAWGGYVFIINLIPLHVFILLLMQRYSTRVYVGMYTLMFCQLRWHFWYTSVEYLL